MNKRIDSRWGFLILGIFIVLFGLLYIPSFVNWNTKHPESEPKFYLRSMARTQKAYFAQNRSFAQSWEQLATVGWSLPAQTEHYRYSVKVTSTAAFGYGIPESEYYAYERHQFGLFVWYTRYKQPLGSYVNGVFAIPVTSETEAELREILCRREASSPKLPEDPIDEQGEPTCGLGTSQVQ